MQNEERQKTLSFLLKIPFRAPSIKRVPSCTHFLAGCLFLHWHHSIHIPPQDGSWRSPANGLWSSKIYGDGSKPWYLVSPKIAAKCIYRYWPIPISRLGWLLATKKYVMLSSQKDHSTRNPEKKTSDLGSRKRFEVLGVPGGSCRLQTQRLWSWSCGGWLKLGTKNDRFLWVFQCFLNFDCQMSYSQHGPSWNAEDVPAMFDKGKRHWIMTSTTHWLILLYSTKQFIGLYVMLTSIFN